MPRPTPPHRSTPPHRPAPPERAAPPAGHRAVDQRAADQRAVDQRTVDHRARSRPHRLAAVRSVSSSAEFAAAVRAVSEVARSRGLAVPVFRSPPALPEVDRSLRRTVSGAVVSVRLGDRPVASVQADVIDGVVAANSLAGREAAGFRRAAWAALGGSGGPPVPRPTAAPAGPAPVRSSPEVTPGSSSDARVA